MAAIGVKLTPNRAGKNLQSAARMSGTEMRRLVTKIVTIAEGEVKPLAPVGASQALRSGYATDGPKGAGSHWQASLVNPTVYHDVAEDGRRPGKMPPVSALIPWVGTVLGIPVEDRRSVAFLVARKIGRDGTEGAHMVEKGWRATRRRIRPELRAAGLRIVREISR